jgi:hypothetical protein
MDDFVRRWYRQCPHVDTGGSCGYLTVGTSWQAMRINRCLAARSFRSLPASTTEASADPHGERRHSGTLVGEGCRLDKPSYPFFLAKAVEFHSIVKATHHDSLERLSKALANGGAWPEVAGWSSS